METFIDIDVLDFLRVEDEDIQTILTQLDSTRKKLSAKWRICKTLPSTAQQYHYLR
ncbi:hypothetical protein WAI453_009580 [Rhynchosporium graminicola]